MTKRVLLLATGDTIAYTQHKMATGAELLAAIRDVPGVTAEDLMAEPSWDTTPGTMLAIARRARDAAAEFDGVVVTHGVDTLAETAFLTDLMTRTGGIVFTGATKHLDEPGSNGPDNLLTAIAAAPTTAGVWVCFNRELHPAATATFTGTGFTSTPTPSRPPHVEADPETDVALIKTYPGMPPSLLTTVTDAGARGVVLEGTGAGNVPIELFIPISELLEWGIPVVIASRARTREIGLAGKVGAISAQGLRPSQARVALMVALGTGSVAGVREWFSRL